MLLGAGRTHRVAIIDGDGIGPSLVTAALTVNDAASGRYGYLLETDRVAPRNGGSGVRTRPTGGSRISTAHPSADGEPARRLKAAGAIVIGKLTTSELGCGSPYVIRHPRNPWHTDHVLGGSSAGGGVAVSARLIPAAIGGDTGGSVRIPPAFCGIVGLRPSLGLVDAHGAIALAPELDTAGPMTRSAGDAELLLRAMGRRLTTPRLTAVRAINCLDLSETDVDPEVAAGVESVARSMAALVGVAMTTIRPTAPLRLAWAAVWMTIYSQAQQVHRST